MNPTQFVRDRALYRVEVKTLIGILFSPSVGGKSKDLALDDNKPEMGWQTILPRSRLRAHEIHRFDIGGLANNVPFTHVKITIYPDGGVQRLRVYGYPAAAPSPKL